MANHTDLLPMKYGLLGMLSVQRCTMRPEDEYARASGYFRILQSRATKRRREPTGSRIEKLRKTVDALRAGRVREADTHRAQTDSLLQEIARLRRLVIRVIERGRSLELKRAVDGTGRDVGVQLWNGGKYVRTDRGDGGIVEWIEGELDNQVARGTNVTNGAGAEAEEGSG